MGWRETLRHLLDFGRSTNDANAMRRGIGMLAILFPVIMVLGGLFFAYLGHGAYRWPGAPAVQPTLSDYHGTQMRNAFVGMLGAIGWYFFVFRGRDGHENRLTAFAGILAIMVSMFPDDCDAHLAGVCTADSTFGFTADFLGKGATYIHLGAAGLMFALLGAICIFRFTKSHLVPTPFPTVSDGVSEGKVIRNRWYIGFGVGIWALLLLAILVGFWWAPDTHGVLALEIAMVWLYGAAWLLKGEAGITSKWIGPRLWPDKFTEE